MDDGLTSEDSDKTATEFQNQLQALFSRAGFLLHQRMFSEPDVLRHHELHLLGKQPHQDITELHAFTKVLGSPSQRDIFCLTIGETPSILTLTKRALVSEIPKTYDVLG